MMHAYRFKLGELSPAEISVAILHFTDSLYRPSFICCLRVTTISRIAYMLFPLCMIQQHQTSKQVVDQQLL